MKTYVAVDLGGTNIRAAIVDEEGRILEIKKDKTEASLGKEHVMAKMEELIASLGGLNEALGIGLGIPGPTDTINGKIILSGYLMPFMTDKDIDFIHANVVDHNIIPLKREDIILGNAGDYTPALGAALYAIDLWLNTNFMTA